MDRRTFLAGIGAGSLAGFGGCLEAVGQGGSDGAPGDHDVGMTANAFTPREVTVAAGEAVVWKNTGTRAHTVTAYEDAIPDEAEYFATGGFDSESAARDDWHSTDQEGALVSGATYEHAFEVPGTYEYVCIPHERAGMTGTVIVEK